MLKAWCAMRQHARFYAEHYRALPERGWRWLDLPVIDPANYWRHALSSWPVLTGPIRDGHMFKTGGSSGDGKLSVFTRAEWSDFVRCFGAALGTRPSPGDRVANLFFAGDLYTSFLFIHGALAQAPVVVCEYPFTGAIEPAALAHAVEQHQINVLACVPAQLMRFASHLWRCGQVLPGVTTILYGGESLFADQIPVLKHSFPNAHIASIGCASVDAGLVGASLPDCALGERRVFDTDTIIEILDEACGLPLEHPGQNGLLVVTSLKRRLMPLIRYPTGDLAAWCEPAGGAGRKFVLRCRASQGRRVRGGTLSLFPEEKRWTQDASIEQYRPKGKGVCERRPASEGQNQDSNKGRLDHKGPDSLKKADNGANEELNKDKLYASRVNLYNNPGWVARTVNDKF